MMTLAGETTLLCASEKGHIEIVKLLLEHGVDVNEPDACTTR
jgi:ankyrin repeat protein